MAQWHKSESGLGIFEGGRRIIMLNANTPNVKEIGDLVVAAPDLLEALSDLVKVYKAGYRRNSFVAVSAIDKAQTIIKKAKQP